MYSVRDIVDYMTAKLDTPPSARAIVTALVWELMFLQTGWAESFVMAANVRPRPVLVPTRKDQADV